MKKNAMILLLLIIIMGGIINSINENNKWGKEKLKFNIIINDQNNAIDYMEKSVEDKSLEHSTIVEELKHDIENYEYLINKLTERVDIHSLEVRERAYEVQATINTDNLTFNIPSNGIVEIDSETFELDIHIKYPPKFRDTVIDERFNRYTNLFEGITHPLPTEKVVTEAEYKIRYEDLTIGDSFDIKLPYYLSNLLNIDQSTIHVVVTDKFDSGSDYMPRNIKKKVYTGGYEGEGTVEEFTYIDDNSCIIQVLDTGASLSFKYSFDANLMITHKKGESDTGIFDTYERIKLPEIIRLGETWEDLYWYRKITGVNMDIETIWGTLKAVEVTSFDDDNPDNWSRYYYTKELGEVYFSGYGMEDVLVEVELID